MQTDVPLKILFRLRAADLLVFTGDEPARILSTDVVKLQQLRRTVDFVFKKLQMENGETCFRHPGLDPGPRLTPRWPSAAFVTTAR